MNKLKNYIKELTKNKVQIGKDIFSNKIEDVENKENIALFINFINKIYKGERIAIYTFPFVEYIENFIIENIDIIKKMFKIIQYDCNNFDIIISGSFGLHIYKLIEENKINFKGNVVVVSGKIRKEESQIKILKQRFPDIEYKDFVFLDDSFVFGGTRDKIEEFLKKYNSRIYKTFAFYTHYRENPDEVYSMFCYSDEIKEKIIPIHNKIEFINKVDLKSYEDIINAEIDNGLIEDIRDLARIVKRIYDNENSSIIEKHIIKFNDYKL